jgi:hypothetical protein
MDQDPFSPDAAAMARGLLRYLDRQGWRGVTEFSLASGRRADVLAVDGRGRLLIVEIKSSVADFRSDRKWREYLDDCDLFAFAVPAGFPFALLPADTGLLVADAYDAVEHRPAAPSPAPLAPARRRQLHVQLARVAAERLRRALDPDSGLDGR